MSTPSLQVIFESRNGSLARNDGFLDYCREQSPHGMDRAKTDAWALAWCDVLKNRESCEFRFRVEVWH